MNFIRYFLFSILTLGLLNVHAFAGISKEAPVVNSNKPTIVVLYTAEPPDNKEEFENLRDVAQFAFDYYQTESKMKIDAQLVAVDDRDDPQHALKALKKLFAEKKPAAIIGPLYSNVAMGLKDFINQVQIPLVSIFATHNDLTKNSQYIFRICASNRRLVKSMADYLMQEVKTQEAKKHELSITVFKDLSDDYSIDLADTFRLSMEGTKVNYNEVLFKGLNGLEHLKDINSRIWSPTKKDILFLPTRDIIAGRVIASLETEPYLVAAIDTVDFLHLMTKLKSQKSHIQLATTSQWLPQKSAFSKKIEEAFQKHFHRTMTINSALTFDAAYTVAQAYQRALDKSISLDAALRDSTKITGVTGLILLGADGERRFSDQFLKKDFIE